MTHNNQWAVIEESAFGETEVDYFSDEDTAARCAFERLNRPRHKMNAVVVLLVQIRRIYATPNANTCDRLRSVPKSTEGWCCFDPNASWEVAYLCDYSGELWWGPHHEACKWPSEADAKKEAEFWSSRARGSRLYRELILVRFVGS